MMYGTYDPWGFGSSSFLQRPVDCPPLEPHMCRSCTCSGHASGCCDVADSRRESWMTPKSTPGRTRKARRTASMLTSGWSGHPLHRSSDDLLSESNFRRRTAQIAPSQAFFNLPMRGRHGLSRSVSCLSSSSRPILEVEHDNPSPPKPVITSAQPSQKASLTLSRSLSCLSSRPGQQQKPKSTLTQVKRTSSKAVPQAKRIERVPSIMANRPLPPTPIENPEEASSLRGKSDNTLITNTATLKRENIYRSLRRSNTKKDESLVRRDTLNRNILLCESFEKDPKFMKQDSLGGRLVQTDYYSREYSKAPTLGMHGLHLSNAIPKLKQDDSGYLEPLPPPLPPRRSSGESEGKWKCFYGSSDCLSIILCCGCLTLPTAFIYKILVKATTQCMLHKHMGEFSLLNGNVQTTPTPSPSQSNGTMIPRKVVVALYDYNAAQSGDLCLRKNEEFDVLDDSEEHWWKMRDGEGREGYAPSNYVREKGNLGLQQYDWYLGDASRQRAEATLMREEKEGCFVVRNSTTNSGIYTLSVFSKMSRVQVKHYHIKTDPDGLFYLSNSIKCPTIPELIYRHQHNPGGLCTRLRNPPSQGRQAPTTAGLSHDKWEIVPSELNLLEELGSGQFGVVRHGKLYGIDVAVKMMKEGTMSEDEFIEEAKVMTKLQHPNLVQLYGVCRRKRPIYIVTEYLKHGSLLNYLRNKEKTIIQKTDLLLDMCLQVCEGMAYLEGQKFIHRDLAARNCLVGSNNVIKVGDFGLARYVVDDEYTGSGGAKFPIKWAAPEVLNYMRFSSKSDVWAFGVLMWEVFTCGKMPYGRHKNAEVVEMVQQGKILDRPRFCPPEVYEVMRKSWLHSQEQRPGFQDIKSEITKVIKNIAE